VTRSFTLLGQPVVHLATALNAIDAEIDPLLWDVAPDGLATLVTRGAYRFTGSPGAATIDIPLQGNGWNFLAGHTIRLEVTQNDTPYLRLDNVASAIVYKSVRLTLPTPTVPPA
jgi:predicted acyl esterase